MARRAVMTEASKGHMSKDDRELRGAVESELRIGLISDYSPIGLDGHGAAAYDAILEAIPSDRMAKVDGFVVETAADALGKMQQLRESLNADGVITDKGTQNPALNAYQKYSEIARKFLAELGCSPSARAKIANDAIAAAKRPKPTIRQLLESEE